MTRVKSIGVLSLLVGTGISTAGAAELGLVGAAGLQFKQLNMEQTFSGVSSLSGGGGSGELTAMLPALTLQGIVFYDALYAAVKVETGLTTEGVDSDIPFTTENTDLSTDVSRDDFSISVGYKVWQDLSLFGGYMYGKTELTPESAACDSVSILCVNTASFMNRAGGGEYRQEYEESGFFVGTSYGWDIGPGRLSASLAYAMMDGKYSDNYRDEDGPLKFDFEGDSNGLSVATTWSAPINDRFAYFVDGRLQHYSMDASDQTGNAAFSTAQVETDEQLMGITAGVQAFF